MKHKIFKALFVVVAATMTFCAEADTETVNGIEWTYFIKDGEASLGSEYSTRAIPESTSGAITIPSTLGGYPVTSIRYRAFNDCWSLTSITIPNSVTSIGEEAFKGCKSLTSVTMPNSVTSIGGFAFFGCSSLTSVTIPNSVTSIGGGAFGGCSSLTSITIPNSVREIWSGAFANCSSLTSVTIPNSVTSIGMWAFNKCSSLTSVTIPDSVKSIGNRAFRECGELTIYTDKGNADRLRKMLENAGANVKEIIEQKAKEQDAEEQKSCGFLCGLVLGCVGTIVILGGLLFWIVRRKKKREGASNR